MSISSTISVVPAGIALERAAAFLNAIGIPCREEPGAQGFIPGVRIESGGLLYDRSCPVSNLLHEAGHVATLPAAWRHLMTGDVSRAQRAMFEDLEGMDLEPDHPLMRAAIQCSDPEATAWAWAAGRHLGLPDGLIILDSEYDGDGPHIRLSLSLCSYVGINGLAHAGFCAIRPGRSVLPAFPALAHWLQAAQVPEEFETERAAERERVCV